MTTMTETKTLDQLCVDTSRTLSMDAVQKANSGHPGTPMALAPLAYVLYTRAMRHNPADADWPDRDRFVLSCGHASMLLYSLLYLSGYDLSLDDIKAFRQWGSKTPGHPERGHTPGVETTTGPLGQGVGNAVGMAIAERLLAEHFDRPDHRIIDHRTWAIVSDGDMMEGVSHEAASLAGHLRLGKLTLIYDDNHITIDGDTALSFSEDVQRRFEAYGWHAARVADGNDLPAITAALEAARAETSRPSIVILRTRPPSAIATRRTASPWGRRRSAAPRRSWAGPTSPSSTCRTTHWGTGARRSSAGPRSRPSGGRVSRRTRASIPIWRGSSSNGSQASRPTAGTADSP